MIHILLSYLFEVPVALAQGAQPDATPDQAVSLPNPLGAGSTITSVIENILKWGFRFALAVVPIIVIIGAFQMLTSSGNPEKFAQGQKTILYAVIGLVVMAAATGIVSLVKTLLTG